jgi:hypothetical protein
MPVRLRAASRVTLRKTIIKNKVFLIEIRGTMADVCDTLQARKRDGRNLVLDKIP